MFSKFYLLFICLFLFLLAACRKENAVDYKKSPHYFYSQDSSKILYDMNRNAIPLVSKANYREVTSDSHNFSVIATEYGKDSKYIYYTFKALDNVHYKSFYWDVDNGLPKDKKHVYLPVTESNSLTVIKYADPKTYEKVNLKISCLNWYRDKNFYFYNHEKTSADRATLSFESPLLPYDKKYIFSVDEGNVNRTPYVGLVTVISDNLLRDNRSFYYKASCDSIKKRIDYKDEQTFRFYDHERSVFRIDACIYVSGIMIPADNLDVDTFMYIEYNYCKDKNNVYYKSDVLRNAEASSFEVLSSIYAKDRRYVYENGKILDGYNPVTFVKDAWDRFPTNRDYGKRPRLKSSDDD